MIEKKVHVERPRLSLGRTGEMSGTSVVSLAQNLTDALEMLRSQVRPVFWGIRRFPLIETLLQRRRCPASGHDISGTSCCYLGGGREFYSPRQSLM